MSLTVQGQQKYEDQVACVQLVYETGQRPEERITTLGLVPRQRGELRQQVTESFCVPDVFFFNWMGPNANQQSPCIDGFDWPSKEILLQ